MKKKSRPLLERHLESLQLATAVAFLLLVGLYASLTGAAGTGLSQTALW